MRLSIVDTVVMCLRRILRRFSKVVVSRLQVVFWATASIRLRPAGLSRQGNKGNHPKGLSCGRCVSLYLFECMNVKACSPDYPIDYAIGAFKSPVLNLHVSSCVVTSLWTESVRATD